MHIKNKFLRFVVSVFITLLFYFLLALSNELRIGNDSEYISKAIETMLLFAVFGLFIVMPALIFLVIMIYYLLTNKSERPKRTRLFKFMFWYLVIMALLYVAAMFTDLFG